jgi:predicted ribosome quality control (RQC) complex YloA/Tae2 family protein
MGKKNKKVGPPREFETTDGDETIRFILGRSQDQNDIMVRNAKRENQNYWWFHADKVPSCHAILFTDKSKLTKKEIQDVSNKIRDYSKLKKMNSGYVIYTQIKNIHLTDIPGRVVHGLNVVKRCQVKREFGKRKPKSEPESKPELELD